MRGALESRLGDPIDRVAVENGLRRSLQHGVADEVLCELLDQRSRQCPAHGPLRDRAGHHPVHHLAREPRGEHGVHRGQDGAGERAQRGFYRPDQ